MALSIDLDPTSFGTPLEGDSPSGKNLQASEQGRAVRSALRDLREEARRMERKADDGDTSDGGWPAARGIWADARDQALDILRTRSRDLDVAAICVEALARTDGFAGLAAGFAMTRAMVESSWDTLFPAPDPEDGPADEEAIVNERTLPLQRLVGIDAEGLLAPAILRIPFTQGRGDEQYALCHWKSSRELVNEESEEKIKLAIERGGVSPAQFAEAVSSTPRASASLAPSPSPSEGASGTPSMTPSASVARCAVDESFAAGSLPGDWALSHAPLASVVASAPASCVYFSAYEVAKANLGGGVGAHLGAGLVAEALACALYVPIDVVKERMQVQVRCARGAAYYASARDALRLAQLPDDPQATAHGLGAAGLKKLELARALATLDPRRPKPGFARIDDETGQMIASAAALSPGQAVTLNFADGSRAATIDGAVAAPRSPIKPRPGSVDQGSLF